MESPQGLFFRYIRLQFKSITICHNSEKSKFYSFWFFKVFCTYIATLVERTLMQKYLTLLKLYEPSSMWVITKLHTYVHMSKKITRPSIVLPSCWCFMSNSEYYLLVLGACFSYDNISDYSFHVNYHVIHYQVEKTLRNLNLDYLSYMVHWICLSY